MRRPIVCGRCAVVSSVSSTTKSHKPKKIRKSHVTRVFEIVILLVLFFDTEVTALSSVSTMAYVQIRVDPSAPAKVQRKAEAYRFQDGTTTKSSWKLAARRQVHRLSVAPATQLAHTLPFSRSQQGYDT